MLAIHISAANVSDSKSAYPLIANILANNSDIRIIKADKGYRGEIETLLPAYTSARLECVKSNFGTPDFIPTHGRWVVERTFFWLDTFQSWDVPLWHAIIQDHNTLELKLPRTGVFSVNFAKSHRSRCSHRSLFNLRNFRENTPPLH